MDRPTFSIITVTYNRAPLLRQAIESVLAQGRHDVEHIIVDGASTDGTLAMLPEYPHLTVHSEPDKGIYDAFNKGVALARGRWVQFLNSDDLLPAGALDAIARVDRGDAVSGGVEFFAGEGKLLRVVEGEPAMAMTVRGILRGVSAINARFFRREFMDRVGAFDLGYRIASDREWLVRAAMLQPEHTIVPQRVYAYRSHEGSLTIHEPDRNALVMRAEHVDLAERLLPSARQPADQAELRALHRRESAVLAVDALVRGDLGQAWQWTRRGLRQNASWPCAAALRLGGWCLGRGSGYGPAAGKALSR